MTENQFIAKLNSLHENDKRFLIAELRMLAFCQRHHFSKVGNTLSRISFKIYITLIKAHKKISA